MPVTAAVVSTAVSVGGALIVGNQAKQQQKGAQAALNRSLEASIASTPKPPSTLDSQGVAAQAASAAAARQRKLAANAGGLGTNVLTSPSGAPPAVTTRKALIGQ